MKTILINGIRMVSAHGEHGELKGSTGKIRTSSAFPKCKSTLIHSHSPRSLLNGVRTRQAIARVSGNGEILSRKERKAKKERVLSAGLDPNMASY